MNVYPTYYFRPILEPVILSKEYHITLRNPLPSEKHIFSKSLASLFGALSDKEKRRILYTLYPFGLSHAEGSLEEIFQREITKLWVLFSYPDEAPIKPFEYAALCGYFNNGVYWRSPYSFCTDVRSCDKRLFLRALKAELPTASLLLAQPQNIFISLQNFALHLEGILRPPYIDFLKKMGAYLALPQPKEADKLFLHYVIAAEILTVSKKNSLALPKQFARNMALIRHCSLKRRGENILRTPLEMQEYFSQCYLLRTEMIHGHTEHTKKDFAEKTNILFHTIRLAIELMVEDPQLFFYIKEY